MKEMERIKKIEQEIAYLRKELEDLRKLRQINYEKFYTDKNWKMTEKVQCTQCGMDLSGVMGYVCNNSNCPTMIKAK